MDKVIDQLVKDLKPLDEITDVEGPFMDPFDGKVYYTGTLGEMKVKFNLKYQEYGKIRIVKI